MNRSEWLFNVPARGRKELIIKDRRGYRKIKVCLVMGLSSITRRISFSGVSVISNLWIRMLFHFISLKAVADCLIRDTFSVFHKHVNLNDTVWRNLSQVGVELLSGDIIRGNVFDDEKPFEPDIQCSVYGINCLLHGLFNP